MQLITQNNIADTSKVNSILFAVLTIPSLWYLFTQLYTLEVKPVVTPFTIEHVGII